jgi:diguanylate cyclase (GGDEF)-like protein
MSGVTKEVLISNTLISYCAISIMLLHSIYTLYWESVYYDPLTGIPNRRAMIDKFNDLNTGYGVAVIDIDKFKNFNDTYGHDEGDNVLKLVANMLYALSGGRAYRFGGEEFVLIYDHMNEQVLEKDLNRIREAIAEKPFYIREGKKERPQYKFPIIRKITSKFSRKKKSRGSKAKKLQITVSMGGVIKMQITKEDKRVPYEDFLKLADNALYKAKDNGRNRVEMADHI